MMKYLIWTLLFPIALGIVLADADNPKLDPKKLLSHIEDLRKQGYQKTLETAAFQRNLKAEESEIRELVHEINFHLANNQSVEPLIQNLTQHYHQLQHLILEKNDEVLKPNTTLLLLSHAISLCDTLGELNAHLNHIGANVFNHERNTRFTVEKWEEFANDTEISPLHQTIVRENVVILEHFAKQYNSYLNYTGPLDKTHLIAQAKGFDKKVNVTRENFYKLMMSVDHDTRSIDKLLRDLSQELKLNKTTETTEKSIGEYLEHLKHLVAPLHNQTEEDEWEEVTNEVDHLIEEAKKWNLASAAVLSHTFHLEDLVKDAQKSMERTSKALEIDTDKDLSRIYGILLARDLETLALILPRFETIANRK